MVLMWLLECRGQSVPHTEVESSTPTKMFLHCWFRSEIHVCASRLEGSAHDVNILANNMSRPDGINIPDDKFYLGDVGYACHPGVLPAFRSTKYHLNEFRTRNYPNAKELFNLRHSSLRVTVERAFVASKNIFKIFDQKSFNTFDAQVKLVLTCCILHNWILGWSW